MDLKLEIKSSKFNVLLIEDNLDFATLLEKRLSTATNPSFQVKHVEQLQEGIKYLAKGVTNVVLLDLTLPDSRGLDTFLKLHEQAPSIQVVVLTGFDDESLGLEVMRQGAQDYLVKNQVDGKLIVRSLQYAIERHRLQNALADLALIDELTGLHNRRGFLTLAEQQVKLSLRTKKGLLLLFIDLDGLKKINDSYGHQTGDQALIDVADILKTPFENRTSQRGSAAMNSRYLRLRHAKIVSIFF